MPSGANKVAVSWDDAYRLIASHFPPISLFEDVADPADLEIVFALEALTNDRLLDEAGDLLLVAPDDRISGHGSSPVMAAFTHISPERVSRFSDGTYGIYYAASDLRTAIAETRHHREVFLKATDEPDAELTMRCYVNQVAVPMHDLRGKKWEELFTENYAAPQAYGKQMRRDGSDGLLYNSVRSSGGECVAAFKPKAVTPVSQTGHYRYIWSHKAQKITHVLEVREVD
ncbi:RES family NAD+ phosphorylase [Neiella marina]|uniref:RES family NAD+ phosphorylase n=1 Tax=Neiella holothuriorum TaxID=2870530 RepID=A0ABS7EJH0_9GAMM|nr:RES family NAD+ phosphorylase [Neiella holothuriorum]MBW8191812.1 RES family NAD+ phosphorylase [Neiella holothuriorum]